jgi:hypothetical protein
VTPTGAEPATVRAPTGRRDTAGVPEQELRHVRQRALALPDVTERLSHGAPCFFVRDKRPLCYFHDHDFDDRARVSLMCPALPGVADALARARPGRFYRPVISANGAFRDWLGMFLDESDREPVDWNEVAAIVEDAYRLVAPKRLVTRLDDH